MILQKQIKLYRADKAANVPKKKVSGMVIEFRETLEKALETDLRTRKSHSPKLLGWVGGSCLPGRGKVKDLGKEHIDNVVESPQSPVEA